MIRKILVLPALAGLLAPVLAACGSSDGSGGDGSPIVVGTTDQLTASKDGPAPLDPAQDYQLGQWNVLRSVYQTLMILPRSGTQPVPEAAEWCKFTDTQSEVYECRLRDGLKFSNGHSLTARDVKFSIDRMQRIKYQSGPVSLIDNVDKVETRGATEVVFHLKEPDATFPQKVATPAAAIVDHSAYSATSLHKGFTAVGSGPYTLDAQSNDGAATKITFTRNPDYQGSLKPSNDAVEMRIFQTPQAMEAALRKGDIDLMNRVLASDQIKGLQNARKQGIVLQAQQAGDIRFLGLNVRRSPTSNKAVREALAQLIDRSEFGGRVYQYQGQPLYSVVPAGVPAHVNSYFSKWGQPSVKKAAAILQAAGVSTPVPLTISFSDVTASVTTAEFREIKRQLEDSKLFEVKENNIDNFQDFRSRGASGAWSAFILGWSPDFPDADNYLAPFVGKASSIGSMYTNREIEGSLLPDTRRHPKRVADAGADLKRMQQIFADDVPIVPLWQTEQYVAARDDVTGAEWAINSSSGLQIWELGRGISD
ncbi:ABC transporter substrate-binding protein [Streptomyces sp. NPDC059740]|uniref:ABC transporter substrate-binding protein n=1 Tax=Streptomyces sp. NPDC059740 TaxID=3346926 RepID=UPI003646D355